MRQKDRFSPFGDDPISRFLTLHWPNVSGNNLRSALAEEFGRAPADPRTGSRHNDNLVSNGHHGLLTLIPSTHGVTLSATTTTADSIRLRDSFSRYSPMMSCGRWPNRTAPYHCHLWRDFPTHSYWPKQRGNAYVEHRFPAALGVLPVSGVVMTPTAASLIRLIAVVVSDYVNTGRQFLASCV